MAKRTVEFDDKHLKTVALVFGLIGSVFTAYFVIDGIYIDNKELQLEQQPQDQALESAEESLNTRIIMSESTRYAQIAKYYRDEMQVRSLSDAEKARLDLVEREQCRLRNELVDGSEICN